MQLNNDELMSLSLLAQKAILSASEVVNSFYKENLKVSEKNGGESLASQVFTEADIQSQQTIIEILKPSFLAYDLGLLTEESEDDKTRFTKDYFWCIDPLDGTLPFIEKVAGFSISIALVSKEGKPMIGVVHEPLSGNTYRAISGNGVYKNDEVWHLEKDSSKEKTLSFFTDRSFLKQSYFPQLEKKLNSLVVEMSLQELKIHGKGGAVMNAIWSLENAPACYFKFPKKEQGGGSLWDYSATACIYQELGLFVTDLEGKSLILNQESTFMNMSGVLYVTEQHISDFILDCYEQMKL